MSFSSSARMWYKGTKNYSMTITKDLSHCYKTCKMLQGENKTRIRWKQKRMS